MADNHKSPLRPEGEVLLQVSDLTSLTPSFSPFPRSQAALSSPFSVPNLPRVSPFQPTNPAAPLASTESAPAEPSDPALSPAATVATSPESSVSPAEFDAWKAEYDSQVVEWRRQSATVRARAEEERARWEERRAHEQQQQQQQHQEDMGDDGRERRDTHASETSIGASDWEAVSHRSSTDAHTAPISAPPPVAAPPAAGAPPPQVMPSFLCPRVPFRLNLTHKERTVSPSPTVIRRRTDRA